ncbi:peptidylprolyl isomerase [Bizionia paragorgiae]|jgi:peptidyl-prolyl cis-trans isomerase A (cyclophilin A)|uniref:peptidylprolyl isomerase n=1 Tax=Bizionia paragorgiae TaxID=283786 RepID=A0A1H4D143_BIZPA|nr:peptidylprolyl isomerase [Bizionia paragorgiae]MDX1272529.1 peptidylprolyl isomerase [Bizionia paragorgiae]SEA66240.1 peptidyl-prolyl cis-trans isomerase A (cyclophilin A) [Bizionia paragorgiae]
MMNTIKQTMKIFILALMATLTSSCQENKYPDLEDGLYAEFVTNKGTMVAKLHYDLAPVTVANFVSLAEGTNTKVDSTYAGQKFYNGTTFHRVIDQFMIQGGDPTATGSGNPGYKFKDEINEAKHDKPGILSMANSGPATNGSQFFITEKPTPQLDPKHTVFGELVVGLEVQDSISNVKTARGDKPVNDVIIEELNIIRKGKDAKKFDAPKVFDTYFVELEEENKVAAEKLAKAKANFLEKNEALKANMKTFPSGLGLTIISEGSGIEPKSTDKVIIAYAGYLADGTLFDTSYAEIAKEYGTYDERRAAQNGYQPFPMVYNETATLIPGFREAMLNMKVGDKARAFIPAALAYGARGAGRVIPPNSDLVFDLEIVSLQE